MWSRVAQLHQFLKEYFLLQCFWAASKRRSPTNAQSSTRKQRSGVNCGNRQEPDSNSPQKRLEKWQSNPIRRKEKQHEQGNRTDVAGMFTGKPPQAWACM